MAVRVRQRRYRERQRERRCREVLLALPEELIAAVDLSVRQRGSNRSEVVMLALRAGLPMVVEPSVAPAEAGGADNAIEA